MIYLKDKPQIQDFDTNLNLDEDEINEEFAKYEDEELHEEYCGVNKDKEDNSISNKEFKKFINLVYELYRLDPPCMNVSISKVNSEVQIKVKYNYKIEKLRL